jgi:dTDP-4-amino-4,6-dideoxygalactose transaminase
MVTTDDANLARRVREFISLGLDSDTYARYGPEGESNARRLGYNVVSSGQRLHMNDVLASIANVQLRRLDEMNRQRACRAARYREAFANVPDFRVVDARPGTDPSHHMFTALIAGRDRFIDDMKARLISIGIHYPPLHEFPIAAKWTRSLPVTEDIGRRTSTFPLYPAMTDEEQARVIAATLELCGRRAKSRAV